MGAIQQVLAAYGSVAAATDPNFASVVLLHNATESNGATTFTDSSSYHRTITTTGGAVLSTTSPPTGAAGSVTMDGVLDAYKVANSTDFDLTSTFTAECFLKTTGLNGAGVTIIGGLRAASGNDNGVFFYAQANGGLVLNVANNGVSDSGTAATGMFTNGVWYHFFVSGDGTNYHVGFNGSIYTRFARVRSPGASNGEWMWGNWTGEGTGTRAWRGQMGPTRVTKGVCRYAGAAAASYTIPTLPFPTSA